MKIKKLLIDYIPMVCAAILIITFSVIKEQSLIKTLPTLVTLVVQILLARANRFAFLLGGINALLYGISYFDEGLYFSVISAVFVSAPIQLYSFWNWTKKQTAKNHTELQILSPKKRICIIAITVGAWLAVYFGLSGLFESSKLPIFDTLTFVIGIVTTILVAFRFVESQYLSAFSSCISLLMWLMICLDNPSNMSYLIISFYNLFMILKAVIHWTRQYIHDTKEVIEKKNPVASPPSTYQK